MLNKRENIVYSLLESSKVDKNWREEEGKAKEKLTGDFSTSVKLDWIAQN